MVERCDSGRIVSVCACALQRQLVLESQLMLVITMPSSIAITVSHLSTYYSASDRGAEHSDDRVCLSVCPRVYLRKYTPDLSKFLCMLPMVMARSSSDGVAIRYALPVLWMTSYFCISQGSSTWLPSWSKQPTCSLGLGYKRRVGIPNGLTGPLFGLILGRSGHVCT